MPKPQNFCIFCGEPGITREHIWADWLKEFIPREMTEHRTQRANVDPFEIDEVIVKRRSGDPHSRRIPCVCGRCNSGWMSGLQEDARPFLVPLLKAQPVRLHRVAQRTLAAWAAMTLMVAEHVDTDLIAVSEEDRRHLLGTKTAPKTWRIWAGAHAVQQFPLYSHNVLEFVGKRPDEIGHEKSAAPNTQTSTICVGRNLLFHAMSSSVAHHIIRRWPIPEQVSVGLRQIWPIRVGTAFWPPNQRLKDSGVDLLANHFFNASNMYVRASRSR
jgi:hypothetical protein